MPHDDFRLRISPHPWHAQPRSDEPPNYRDGRYTETPDPDELFLADIPTRVEPQHGQARFPAKANVRIESPPMTEEEEDNNDDDSDNDNDDVDEATEDAADVEPIDDTADDEETNDTADVKASGTASPSDKLDQWLRDTGPPYPDDDAGLSIYAFLPEVSEPTGAAAPTVLDASAAADIASTYPDVRRDIFVAALRTHDPQCKKYRHLHLFAAAASAGPDERALDAQARFWDKHLPLNAQPSASWARAATATTQTASEQEDPAVRHIVEMEHWLRQWFTLLYQPHLVTLTPPATLQPPDLSALSQLTDLAQRLEHMRRREIALRKLRWDADVAEATAARQRTFDAILADTAQRRRPRAPSVPAPWYAKVFANIERAYADLDYKFRSSVGSSRDGGKMLRGIARADAAYRALPAETRVVAALLATGRLLERVLARRHVEREHLARRVWLFDTAASARTPLAQLWPLHTAATEFVEAEVRRIQHVAMHTHAYRYFQRTRIPQPWKELFLVMACSNDNDDDDDDEDEIRAVRGISEKLGPLKNTARQPLLLRPVAEQDMSFVAVCDLCGDRYAREQVVLKTWCNHLFHFACIFRRWDSETSSGWDCPTCAHTAAAPGSMFGLQTPHVAPDALAVNQLKQQYLGVLRLQQRHPEQPLQPWMKEVRMAYYRHMRHNRDKRSFVGVRAYSWHPLPLEALYEEEGLPRTHPQYRYDFKTHSLVPANRGDSSPQSRVVIDANGQAVLETVVPGSSAAPSTLTREQQFAAEAPHVWPSVDPFAPPADAPSAFTARARVVQRKRNMDETPEDSKKRVRFD